MMATQSEFLAELVMIYDGSDGEATRGLYERLQQLGPAGGIAVELFRAQKNSARAKVYRGGSQGRGYYRGQAYDRKQWALKNLAEQLNQHALSCGLTWGWGMDPSQPKHDQVLYVDLPTGQVSFHTDRREAGPDYAGQWDCVIGRSPERILRWCARLLAQPVSA